MHSRSQIDRVTLRILFSPSGLSRLFSRSSLYRIALFVCSPEGLRDLLVQEKIDDSLLLVVRGR